jgi:hypothetical protein
MSVGPSETSSSRSERIDGTGRATDRGYNLA